MHSDDATTDDPIAELQRRLDEALRHLDQQRELAEHTSRDRDQLRHELAELRKQHDGEVQAHARRGQAHDLAQSRVATLEAEAAELRREGARQTSRADQAARELQAVRRDLASEQAAHRAAQDKHAALEATHRSGAADLLAERAAHDAAKEQLRKAHAEFTHLQQRVAADQKEAQDASQRAESLGKEVGVLADRLTLIKRQLQDEINAHALTRKQLEEQREATQAADRRRRGNGVLGAIGGAAAIGLGLLLRRK